MLHKLYDPIYVLMLFVEYHFVFPENKLTILRKILFLIIPDTDDTLFA